MVAQDPSEELDQELRTDRSPVYGTHTESCIICIQDLSELLLAELPRITEYTDLRRWPVPGIYVCYLLTYKNCPSITARWTNVQRKDS